MDIHRNINILLGVLVVLVIAVLINGQITGKAVSVCSKLPEITYIEQLADGISINWEDTSTTLGEPRYDILIYQQKEDGTYDFNDPYRYDLTKQPYFAFRIADGTYVAKIRAKNRNNCPTEYTSYVISKEITKE